MQFIPPFGETGSTPYADRNTSLGVDGSRVPAQFFNDILAELLELITFAGLTPSAGDLTQVRQAIQAMILAGVPTFDPIAQKRIALLMFNRLADESLPAEGLVGDFYDSFEDGSGVDGGSTNATVDAAGYLRNSTPGGVVQEPASPGANHESPALDRTVINLDAVLPNGALVTQLGYFQSSGLPTSPTIVIVRQDAADTYTLMESLAVTPQAAGWADFALPSAYVVPGTGTFLLGFHVTGGQRSSNIAGAGSRANAAGLIAGTDAGFTTVETSQPSLRATYAGLIAAMDYRSVSQELAIEPVGGTLIFTLEDVDLVGGVSGRLNTTILGHLSKDDGSTWEAVTLSIAEQVGGLYTIAGTLPEMAVTGDKTCRLRIQLPDTRYRIHAAGLQGF